MSLNFEKVKGHCGNYQEDGRVANSRADGLGLHYTKRLIGEYIPSGYNVIELSCATGCYGMYFADKSALYTGVDLSPDNINSFAGYAGRRLDNDWRGIYPDAKNNRTHNRSRSGGLFCISLSVDF